MKNKELLHEALKLNDNKGVEQLIKRFLLSNELSNTKFNIYNYIASKKSPNTALKGVLHEGKYKIATDAHILIVLAEEYPEEIEGKIIDKEGKEIDEQFPNWRSVIPNNNDQSFDIPFADIKKAYKQYKIDKKVRDDIIGIWNFNGEHFQIELLYKLIIFAEYIGATQFKLGQSGKAGIVEANNSKGLVMPLIVSERTEQHIFYNKTITMERNQHKQIVQKWCEQYGLIETGILGSYAKGILESHDLIKISKRLIDIKQQMDSKTMITITAHKRIEADIFNERIITFSINTNKKKAERIIKKMVSYLSDHEYILNSTEDLEHITKWANILNYSPEIKIVNKMNNKVRMQMHRSMYGGQTNYGIRYRIERLK